jgi:glyoxylase-like metal-dependent hydrolase (beta-lactamase superfamily II)
MKFIREQGLIPEYIILTHGHSDHTGGIKDLLNEFPDIKLVASEAERDFLKSNRLSYGSSEIECDLYVQDGETLKAAGTTLQFISTPGHTPGGMCIHVDGVLFSGDTLFRSSIGRSDFPGGDHKTLIHSIREKLFVLPESTRVLPGHDDESTIGYEVRNNPFV